VEGGIMNGKIERMAVDPQTIRKNLVGLLRLLSSEAEQVAYQQDVPYVNVCGELICMWFSDLYHPEDPFFRSCFTQPELDAMARFNQLYSQKKQILPYLEHHPEIRYPVELQECLRSPAWREVMAEAAKAVATFPQGECEA
jgi:hypothetical protein